MPAATAREAHAFIRRTSLSVNEYHTNFRKVDCETISRLTSEEAGRVTSQMCKVYLSLINAPTQYLEREGVLRFAGEERGGEWVTAWEQLISLVGVASATARKALRWMHEQGIVGYFAGRNGVGIRIFLNRATSSVGRRPMPCQKNLRLVRAATEGARTSTGDTPFNDSFADLEVSEKDLNPRPPAGGADESEMDKKSLAPTVTRASLPKPENSPAAEAPPDVYTADDLVQQIKRELEPSLRAAARTAAIAEHERTREWLESRGLPKAVRVAQRETYNLLRQHGLIRVAGNSRAGQDAGRCANSTAEARPLSQDEVRELAETCVAMLEVHGQSIDATLAELSAEAGGFLLTCDAPRVRELAEAMAYDRGKG